MKFPASLLLFCLQGVLAHPKADTPRVAIIGAGAGGSSAAFWISKGKQRFGVDVEIDVYESANYIGGRSTVVYPHNDKSLQELEIGASIFVQINENLWRASDEFNLTRRVDETGEVGIWDGKSVLFRWTDGSQLPERYDVSSLNTFSDFVSNMVSKFLTFYSAQSPKWDNIPSLNAAMGWVGLTSTTTAAYLKKLNVSNKVIFELVEGSTRVNYGQNADFIHALEGAASNADGEAVGIAGGNFKIFEQFLKRSGANVFLSTPVKSISSSSSSASPWSITSSRGTVAYKAVILAAPFHQTGITAPSSISSKIPQQPYYHLYVTLVATTQRYPNQTYFGLAPGSAVPDYMITTAHGAGKPEFNSVSYQGPGRPGESIFKIFSDHAITDEWVKMMFGQATWVFRKQWDAYPLLAPTTTFPPVRVDKAFYYVNSFEPFMSTMETETISSRNIVDLMLKTEFNAPGLCPKKPSSSAGSDDFVLGWDC